MKAKKQKSVEETSRTRILVLLVVLGIAVFMPLIAKMYKIQIIDHDKYESMAIDQQTSEYSLTASRGAIYDRNYNMLAYSATAENIFLSPLEIHENDQNIALIANSLAEILGVDPVKVTEMAGKTKSQYEVVARKVDETVADQVRQFIVDNDIKGVHLEETSKRYYPYSSLAAQIIGFVGMDNYGLSGIEAEYNSTLSGSDGLIVTARDGHGDEMLFKYEQYYDAQDGDTVVLTIDNSIQYFLEKNLASAMADFDVLDGAYGLVMNVNSGEILAMATLGSFDPNNPNEIGDEKVRDYLNMLKEEGADDYQSLLVEAQMEQWRNRVVNDTYEPGSTFKVITMAMAVEEGLVSLDEHFFCTGNTGDMYIAGRLEPISCWKKAGHGDQTLSQTLANSCNPAFAAYGLRLGAETFYDYLESFGFLEKTGVDLPGESGSIFWGEDLLKSDVGPASLTVGAFGQTFKITPLQLASAYCAVVNGGYLVQPYIIKEVLDADGNIVEEHDTTVVRQVISEETSQIMCEMLEGVVSGGSGKNAQLSGYSIGGKTGTSENIEAGTEDLIVSFYGVAPMDDPEIVVAVILDTPSTATGLYISGGVMAAPVASSIFADILPYLGIEPNYTPEELAVKDIPVPDVVGKDLGEAVVAIESNFKLKIVGNGDIVTGQTPTPGGEIPAGSTVILYLEQEKDPTTVVVPNLVGMTASRARNELTYLGLYMHTTGNILTDSGYVIACRQSIPEGTEVAIGTVIDVQFSDTSVGD